MVDFFSSEVSGVVFASAVFAFAAAYVAFIIYLVSWGIPLSKNKSITNVGN